MPLPPETTSMLRQEARALLTRLVRVKPFALVEAMLPAAAILPRAQVAIEDHLTQGRKQLHRLIRSFLKWLESPEGLQSDPAEAQRRFCMLRLRFNAALTQFDMFDDALTQRSENETGVWLSGLDVVSDDAVRLAGNYYEPPPLICYLDRGVGAAIRRARTRLPGGGDNPVSIVRVPRERMIGCGIASSLVHEVGHQGAALLNLVVSLRTAIKPRQSSQKDTDPWMLWDRWISEVVADLWSVARVGVSSTLGLIGVVSLPRPFVFRLNVDDPHPMPWIRVRLSAAIGEALYPHPQWERIARMWESFYPLEGLSDGVHKVIEGLLATMKEFTALLVDHRPKLLRGRSLREAFQVDERQPAVLTRLFDDWSGRPWKMYEAAPSLVFAVLGQARADERLTPEQESTVLAKLLTHWALRSTLEAAANGGCLACRRTTRARGSNRSPATIS